MVFSSLSFLCVFLPMTFLAYLAMPGMRSKNALLIIASIVFYAYGEPVYVLLLVASTVVNYAFGMVIGPVGVGRHRKALLVMAVVANLGALAVFKYAGMLVETFDALTGLSVPDPSIALPLGISFYTFQALSYVIDVYRGDVEPQRSYPHVLLYVAFFPQLVAGPIVKYHDIEQQISLRSLDVDEVARGFRRFCVGLGKKVLIANAMGSVADALFSQSPDALNAPAAWLAAVAYLMQIYFDFSAYSDMAIGLGHMFGFTFKENFDYPYVSCSIKEFWRRWHISLSTWFKEYLYIPLGGNRKGRLRTGLNKVVVFFLCGLWHGASWTFVVWGLIHGGFSLLEEVLPSRRLPRALGHVYVLLVVTLAFVVFRCDTLSQAGAVIVQMFTAWDLTSSSMVILMDKLTPLFICTFVVAMLACTPLRGRISSWLSTRPRLAPRARFLSYVGALLLLGLCLVSLSSGTYNPFIYFRF
ncbi:MAG: hypothetical protein PHR15_07390 [Atopobiaceae bacterium]|jgi:alginate O-acetyltransferase complex protein AlgI|nr:hypothetical protein [Atopobiaceae bacterium]MCH4180747.1 hypothetical protein [Atopobiaceae bacterium]MCH4215111.1 hypothetical protein [Atopobiaceae bacterium]MCH4277241.1 hypothetical protein [Atopobiaceae bacterium]MCI1226771.1 hypothetical protein [Atopobiaceae bacterium]